MSTPAPSPAAPPPASPPTIPPDALPSPLPAAATGEALDLEEDVAPNLGGEDQMQDA